MMFFVVHSVPHIHTKHPHCEVVSLSHYQNALVFANRILLFLEQLTNEVYLRDWLEQV